MSEKPHWGRIRVSLKSHFQMFCCIASCFLNIVISYSVTDANYDDADGDDDEGIHENS